MLGIFKLSLKKFTGCPSLIFKLILLVSLTANYAYSAGPDAGSLMRDQQELDRLKNLPTAPRARVLEDKPSSSKQNANESKILVKGFEIEGQLKAFTADQLKTLIQDLVGQELTFSEIQSAADRITRHYQSNGYFLAAAIIPKQEVVGGIVKILVNEGKLDSKRPYEIKGQDLRMPKERVAEYIDTALDGELYQPSLERGLLNIADNPQMTATANIEPGEDPGSSRIVVETVEGPKVDGSVTADTYGSRYTGTFRLTGKVNLNNPSEYGDQFSATAITAPGEVFNMGTLAYSFPLGTDGWRGGISYTALNFHLGKELKADPPTLGTSHIWNANLRYPLYRTAASAAYFGLTYDWKASYNESNGAMTSDKRTNLYGTNLTFEGADTILGAGFSQAIIGFSTGNLDLSRYSNYLVTDEGQTHGHFNKTTLQLLRIQRATERLSLQFLGNAQWTEKNLDGSEKLSLGGPAGVRAYPVGEGAGDVGAKYSLDAKYVLATGTAAGDIVGSLFYDYGKIYQYRNSSLMTGLSTPNHFSLQGWGIGLDAIAAGKFQFKFGWAKAIGSNPMATANSGNNADGKSNRSRYWLLGMVTF
jgi:hemolysin activation/secretion protein